MSLVLMMIYWVFIPFLVFRAARWLFGRTESPIGKGLVVAATVGLFSWFLWIAVGENMWLDHQVKELCAKDGGVKVYETVVLPPERFDKYGNVRIPPSKRFAKPEDEYYLEAEDDYYYRESNPIMYQSRSRIIRRSDGKVLGESISYHRGEGGLPGPWYGSSFSCPDSTTSKFEPQIFLKGDKK